MVFRNIQGALDSTTFVAIQGVNNEVDCEYADA